MKKLITPPHVKKEKGFVHLIIPLLSALEVYTYVKLVGIESNYVQGWMSVLTEIKERYEGDLEVKEFFAYDNMFIDMQIDLPGSIIVGPPDYTEDVYKIVMAYLYEPGIIPKKI